MAAVTETVRVERGQVPAGSAIRRGFRSGLLGGLLVVYLAAVGLVERFNATSVITDVLSLGPAFFLGAMLFAGYLAARDRKVEGEIFAVSARDKLVAGVIAGAVTGAITAAFVLLFNEVNVRDIFVSFSPALLGDAMTFGQEPGLGALLQLGVGTALGTLGAALRLVDPRNRKVFIAAIGTMLIVGVLERLLRVMFDNLGLETTWLYRRGGLTVSGAIGMFVLGGVVAYLVTHREQILRRLAGERRIAGEGGVLPPSTQENLALGLGLASLVLSGWLAVRGLLEHESSGLLLILALALGLVAIGVAAVTVRKRTGGAGRGTVKAGRARIGFFAAVAGVFIIVPLIVGVFLSHAMVTVGIYVLLGLGLNIVVGYAGLLDLGYVAFFAVGAYTTALLTSVQSSLVTEGVGEFGSGSQVAADNPWTTFWIALPFFVIPITVIAGVLIGAPVLRLRGDYLAIVTLGFGEIVRVIVRSDWAANFLGGSQGIKQIQAPEIGVLDFGSPQNLYYLVLVFILLAIYVSWRLQYSRVGRAWAAMREDEDVAEAMGVSVIKYKLLAFAMGAGVGCLSGAFFAVQLSVITPDSFELLVSITVLAAIILGGLGSIPGVIVGAVVLVGLPEILRDFAEYRLLFYGAILVGIMIGRPEGLIASARRRRELHERTSEAELFEHEFGTGGPEPAVTAAPGEARQET